MVFCGGEVIFFFLKSSFNRQPFSPGMCTSLTAKSTRCLDSNACIFSISPHKVIKNIDVKLAQKELLTCLRSHRAGLNKSPYSQRLKS